MSRASRLIAVSLVAALVLAPSLGRAQSAGEREKARKLFEDGKARRDRGDKQGALESFEGADELMKVPTTRLAVARALVALGQLIEARYATLSVALLPAAPRESQPFKDAREAARGLAHELDDRIPSLTINVVAGSSDAAPLVSVDGVVVPNADLPEPRRVNPGKHVVIASFGGRSTTVEAVLAEKEARSVTLAKPQDPAAPLPTTTVDPVPLGPRSSLVWIGLGVVAVGAGVGTVAGIISTGKTSEVEGLCRDSRCPPSAHSVLDGARTWATVSTAAFIGAGAGLALTAVGLLLGRSAPSARARAGLFFSPAGVGGSF